MGPTVVLRPVNDVITENEDGLVELYIENPSLNEVTLNVDARISVPSGIHVYGQGFGQAGAAGTVYGIFSVPPGNARTIYIDVKGEKVGTSTVHFAGLYWPGDNKDDYNPISLTHPFTVEEPSKNPTEAPELEETSGVNAEGSGSFSAPGFGAIIAGIGLLGVYMVRRK
ncbi:PGF-CTERM sorting domain-containing protein [Methanosarcina horonobensis]|uniref:PGF-CTERM sorting domain-containing protein n=1 Tax=Methanosarcina horonobensis TaxID=418008 RepID=UPI000B0E43B3|nr:PGF-CTERM sorting domain-containing protein [Methanosarcina horonobensis]